MILHNKLNGVCSSCLYSLKKLFSTTKRCTNPAIYKCFSSVAIPQDKFDQNECDRIAKLLDVDEEEAHKIITEVPGILNADEANIKKTLLTLKRLKYPETVKIKYPKILLVGHARLENYFLIYKESGIHVAKTNPIPLTQYYSFKSLVIKRLKYRVISPNFDVLQSYIKTLNINENDAKELQACLPKDPERLTLEDLRLKVMVYYLSKAWDCRTRISEKLMRDNPLTYNRSLTWIRQLTEILQNNFEMPFKKLCRNSFVLNCNPQTVLKMYETSKTVRHGHIVEVVNKYPRLISYKEPEKLKNMDSCLLENNISPKNILRFPLIYRLSLATLKQRLIEMKENPNLEPYSSHPRAPFLMYYQNTFNARIDEVKEKNLISQMTLSRILSTPKTYERFINVGLNASGVDVISTLHQLLPHKTKAELRNRINRNRHWMHASPKKIIETFHYLQTFPNLTKESIFQCLPILLYPIPTIEDSWKVTLDSGESKLEDSHFLAMVTYFIEKRWNFSGDGVWEYNVSDTFSKEFESEVQKDEEVARVILDDYELQRYKETDSIVDEEDEDEIEDEVVEELTSCYPETETHK